MKERLTGIGLILGTALTLGVVWADSAHAFSLNSEVTVENFLVFPGTSTKIPYGGSVPIEQGPIDVVVSSDTTNPELSRFGGIWDINLGNNSISFTLNSLFSNVTSGDDIYRFKAPSFGLPGQNRVTGFTVTPLAGSLAFGNKPVITRVAGNWIDVVFPVGFAPGNQPNLTLIPGQLGFKVNLEVEPTPVPTPALLPGLVGMGLAALRQRREDGRADKTQP
nr:PTPA-CTERM sorting domain-containing protein [Nodosilinea sp. FACHB-13]